MKIIATFFILLHEAWDDTTTRPVLKTVLAVAGLLAGISASRMGWL